MMNAAPEGTVLSFLQNVAMTSLYRSDGIYLAACTLRIPRTVESIQHE